MIRLKDIGYEVDSHQIFSGVDFAIAPGEKVGLIGPNGAGKTTLLQVIAGIREPTTGKVIRDNSEIGLLPQNLEEWFDTSIYDFIAIATGVASARTQYEEAEKAYQEAPGERTLNLFHDAVERLGRFGAEEFDATLAKALRQAGLSSNLTSRRIRNLSGGQQTRVALAAIIASRYDIVLLDEPTNNLDLEGVATLEHYINKSKAAFIMVSHDRRFLRNATGRIIELLGGYRGVNQYGLGYDEYVAARTAAYANETKHYAEHKATIKSLEASARTKRTQATAAEQGGRKKSDNDKLTANYRSARAANHIASQAQGINARIERLKKEAPHKPQEPVTLDFNFTNETYAGKKVLEVRNAAVQYKNPGGGVSTFGPHALRVSNGERIAITGANGTGKTTFIKLILGKVAPSEGDVFLRSDITTVYIDQEQSLAMPQATALENLMHLAPNISRKDAMHLLVKFGFDAEELITTSVQKMSGGERAKILLASIVAKQASLLVMDEPTNNLDIPTIDALQAALQTYRGAIIIVSHDRDFIDGLEVNRTIAL